MLHPAFLTSDPRSAALQAIPAAYGAQRPSPVQPAEQQIDPGRAGAGAGGPTCASSSARTLSFRALFCHDDRGPKAGQGPQTEAEPASMYVDLAAGLVASAAGVPGAENLALLAAGPARSSDPTQKRRKFLAAKAHELHTITGADVFIFVVHERSSSAYATAGLAGALSQPHLQTLNDLSRRPKSKVTLMPAPDKSTVSAGPADDARYLRCSAAANIAFASARLGQSPPGGVPRSAGGGVPGRGLSEGGGTSAQLAAGSEDVRRFEVEELPSDEGTDSDA